MPTYIHDLKGVDISIRQRVVFIYLMEDFEKEYRLTDLVEIHFIFFNVTRCKIVQQFLLT